MRRPPVEKHKEAASMHVVPRNLVFFLEFILIIVFLTIAKESQWRQSQHKIEINKSIER